MTESEGYIGIRVNPETKTRWQQAAEQNPEYRSLTHLIAVAVKAELNDDQTDGGQQVDVDLSRFHERFDSLSDQMDTIEDRLDETYFLVREDESQYTEIAGRILDLIPTGDREAILGTEPPEDYDDGELEAVIRRTGSVTHLTRMLQREGYKPLNVKDAVERLEKSMATVEASWARPQAETDKRIYRLED